MFKSGTKKLRLHKETLRQLTRTDLALARGGVCYESGGGQATDDCTVCRESTPASRVINTGLYPCGNK
jgi:hypothetical protein